MQNSGVKPNSLSDKKNNSHAKRGKLSDTLQEAAPLAYVRRKMNLRGFVKFKKIEKLGSGWVGQVTTRICFLGDFFVFVFFAVHVSIKDLIRGWVGVVWPIPVFLGFFLICLSLTRPRTLTFSSLTAGYNFTFFLLFISTLKIIFQTC